jgi:hypothetical protein
MMRRSFARRRGALIAGLALALLGSAVPVTPVLAAVTVTPATGGGAISADSAGAAYTTLVGPTLAGTTGADFASGASVVLTAPAGFAFRAGFGNAMATGAGCTPIVLAPLAVTTTTATLGITTAPSGACSISFSGLQVRPTAGTPLASGNILNTGSAGPAGATNYGTLTEVPGDPVLTFATQPSPNNTAATPFATQPVVHSEDQFGNDRPGDPVSLAITPGTGAGGAALTCTTNPVATNASGNASFAGCRIDRAAINYRLRATVAGDTEDSNLLNVAVGPAHHLAFTAHPASTTPAALAPQPAVGVFDEGGNLLNVTGTNITLTIDQHAGTFTCTGGTTRQTAGGVATFSGCQQTTVATNYNLTANDGPGGLPAITGPNFDVTSGAAAELRVCWGPALPCNTSPPGGIAGGTAFSVQPTVRVTDTNGNTVASDSTTVVTLAIAPGTPASGGPGTLQCTGGPTRTVVNGVATFTGCSIDRSGTGYRLRATATGLNAGQTNTFTVAVGPAAKLGFLTQPTTAAARATFSPNLSVAVQDAGGNTVTGTSTAVTILIANNASGAVLSCTGGTTVGTTNGVATFTGCSIDRAGTFTLTATPGGVVPPGPIAPATSAPILVTAPAAQVTLAASSTVITWGGTAFFTIQFGANGANRAFTMQASTNGVAWATLAAPPLVANAAGQGVFAYRPARNLWYRAVFAGAQDLAAANSNVVRVVVRQLAPLRPTNGGRPKFVEGGTPSATVQFTTTVRPNRPELPRAVVRYVVYEFYGRTWRLVSTRDVAVDANGQARTTVTFTSPTRWYVRSQALPTSANANSVWSPVELYYVGFPGLDLEP